MPLIKRLPAAIKTATGSRKIISTSEDARAIGDGASLWLMSLIKRLPAAIKTATGSRKIISTSEDARAIGYLF
ncbi:MAG: hypothetical protein EAZ70_08965 [Runella slithyformis]|nr:MAG: hypothetical protein EAY79_09645 [Runella slithyformis]TAF26302.1 MAG: hypothetical protein EAZ70_08965 [Runella slithyformis]TAF44930.1 MAG: hypothetical protein EAZ63_11625 [Runella slithyformis]TAF80398.1 MAG: hypothetical protein EAZ50_08955 [Runella slithyformis]